MTIDLNGPWELTFGPQPACFDPAVAAPPADWPTIAAEVPGNVELDLIRAGRLPENLAQGNRIYELQPYELYQWWYRRVIDLAPGEGEPWELVFDGLDCLATVFVNGWVAGRAANMLVPQRFDISELLQSGPNELVVRLDSAVLAGREAPVEPGCHAMAANWESLPIRKAPHMYGWDILPRVVSAGLWRGVRLEQPAATAFWSVYWTTVSVDAARPSAVALVDWDIATDQADLTGWRVQVTLRRDGVARVEREFAVHGTHGRERIAVQPADLWWPRGMGEPALYDAELHLLDASGAVVATHCERIGLRRIELERTDVTDESGGEFVFWANGHKVFAKGTNWVPLDALHSRDLSHLDEAVAMLVELNCNMVRCWGGNVYEDHPFFDRCDAAGIMVWQDFALACAVYPQTDDFAAVLREEAEVVVTRLRNHPSLVLWAGNNEIDEAYRWSGLGIDPNLDRLSREVLPQVIRRLDPWRPYLPSSPYLSPELMRRGGHARLKPEDHLWGPRDDFKGPFYTSSPAHFVSEIGYHGCPEPASLAAMMDPEHLWPWQDNDQWLTHAARPLPTITSYDYRIPLMAKQIAVLFGDVPTALEPYVLASQLVQAEALKFFLERWRAGKWRRTGMLWWNLRDGWPVISDAVVDYYGRRKLAYAWLQRLQADVLAILGEPEDGRQAVYVVNDTLRTVSGRVVVRDGSDTVLFETACEAPANESVMVGQVPAASEAALWRVDWESADGLAPNHYLAGPRAFDLRRVAGWLRRLELPDDLAAARFARVWGR